MRRLASFFVTVLVLLLISFLFHGCRDFIVVWTEMEYPDTPKSNQAKINVYLENSGSMNGYMCDGSELKDAVYSYVSTIGSYADTVRLNYINTQIIPAKTDLKSFISNLNVNTLRHIGGNTSHSDIADMLSMLLQRMDKHDISIFISDCILDVPQGNAKDYLVNRQIDIRNAFVKKFQEDEDLGVEIFRLESKFNGKYFYYTGFEQLKGVKRPYYMWVLGNKYTLAQLNRKVPFSEIKHGVKDYFAYSTFEEVPFKITNQFDVIQNPCVCKTATNGQYQIKIQADLSSTLQMESDLCDVSHYKTQNQRVRVESVERIADSKNHNTHVLTLNIDKNIGSCSEAVKYVIPATPLWLEAANDETGDSIMKRINKTTGIKYIISGVADAYKDYREIAGIKFVINNN